MFCLGGNLFLTNNFKDYEKFFTKESRNCVSYCLVFINFYNYNVCVMKWNRDEWQGRSKKQVEENYKSMEIIYILFFVLIVAYLISSLF